MWIMIVIVRLYPIVAEPILLNLNKLSKLRIAKEGSRQRLDWHNLDTILRSRKTCNVFNLLSDKWLGLGNRKFVLDIQPKQSKVPESESFERFKRNGNCTLN